MKHWEVWMSGRGLNAKAHIVCNHGPWWVVALDACVDKVGSWMPEWNVPLIGRVRIIRDGERYTFGEYYGTCLGCLFAFFVSGPVQQWTWRRYRRREVAVPMTAMVEAFGDDAEPSWRDSLKPFDEDAA